MRVDEERFAPKPVRSDTERGRLLMMLEVPACRCPRGTHDSPLPPCSHIRALATRFPDVTLHEFLALLREEDLDRATQRSPSYDGPKLPAPATVPFTPHAAATLFDERAAAGLALHHPDDGRLEDEDEMGYRDAEDTVPCDSREQAPEPLPAALHDLWYAEEAEAEDLLAARRHEEYARGYWLPADERLAARRHARYAKGYALALSALALLRAWRRNHHPLALSALALLRRWRRAQKLAARRREVEAAFLATKAGGR